jgi:hypothetical protein
MSTDTTPYTFPDNNRGAWTGLVDAVRAVLTSTGEPPAIQQHNRQELATNAKALAGNVVTRVKQKPIPPALIVAGVGIGLVFLLNKRARGAALAAGGFALDQYRRRMR